MLRFPPLEPRERRLLVRRVRDGDERHLRLPRSRRFLLCRALRHSLRARRRDASTLAIHLLKVWRPGRVAKSGRFVACRELEQRVEGTDGLVHPREWICGRGKSSRHRQHREVRRLAVRDLVPAQRCGHTRVRQRTHGVCGARRAVLRVLVVVEKDAAALLLPPLRRRDGRCPTFHLARERQRRSTHLGERPAVLDAHVHVHAARAARLGPPAQTDFFQQSLRLRRDAAHVVPRHARTGIEVDAQLVGVIEVGRADGVWMQLDAAEVDDPGETRGIVHDDLLGRAA